MKTVFYQFLFFVLTFWCFKICNGECEIQCFGKKCASGIGRGLICRSDCASDTCSAKCTGHGCEATCTGIRCFTSCSGTKCHAKCFGLACVAQCTGDDCTKSSALW